MEDSKKKIIKNLTLAMELYWLNQLKKNSLIDNDEYLKLRTEILKNNRI